MRTTTRIALGITTVALTLAPATNALASNGNQAPATNETATDFTLAPQAGKTLSPGVSFDPQLTPVNGNQVEAANAPQIDPEALSPQDGGQVSPQDLSDIGQFVTPSDDGDDGVQISPADVSGLGQLVSPNDDGDDNGGVSAADLADLGRFVTPNDDDDDNGGALEVVPQDPTIPDWVEDMIDEAVADALSEHETDQTNTDTAQAATELTAETTEDGIEPWMFGAAGAAAVLAIWASLAIGGRLATRRS